MAGIFTRFTLRTLARNRVRTAVTVVGIALSTALMAAVLTSVASLQAGMLQRTMASEGSWHVFSSEVPAPALDALEKSDHVSDLVSFTEGGSAAFSEVEAHNLGEFLTLRSLPTTVKGSDETDGAAFARMPELIDGSMPQKADEIILPDLLKGQTLGTSGSGGVSSDGAVQVGGVLTADLGVRTSDDGQEPITGAHQRTFKVVGFYKHQPPFLANNYTAARQSLVALSVADAPAGVSDAQGEVMKGVYVTTQGLHSLKDMSTFFENTTGIDSTDTTLYHTNLFPYLGITDNRPIWGGLWMFAAVLAAVIVVASVSLIYNAFAISVAERTRQFGLLASLGASKRQLRRTVLVEALLLGVIGVPLGLLLGIAGTAGVFAVSKEAFAITLGSGATGLDVQVDAGILAVAAALSFVTLVVSAWVPSARAARVSAVDAIRQTQDVRVSKRIERRAASMRDTGGSPVKLGAIGRLFGIPGFVAHRNLSRSTSRGRIVVASLAVSVALVVVTGSVALYLAPLSDQVSNVGAAGSGADIVASVHPGGTSYRSNGFLSDQDDELKKFLAQASKVEGLTITGSCLQGQAQGVIDGNMIDNETRRIRLAFDKQGTPAWVPPNFGKDGTYYGLVNTLYIDDVSWRTLIDQLDLDRETYTNPAAPRAIGLNVYQDRMPDGTYVSATPFAASGTIKLYSIAKREGFSTMGVKEGADGQPVVVYLDQARDPEDGASLVTATVEEAATMTPIQMGSSVSEVPAAIAAVSGNNSFPSIILPDSAATSSGGQDESPGSPFMYSSAGITFTATDHTKATGELEEIAKNYAGLSINVNDIVEAVRQNRLITQAIQLFVLCFSVITMLIAVANVFNTLANGIILRTREFATLRSVGMGNRAFARMLTYECASYALRGLGIGLVVATAATYAMFLAMSRAFVGLTFTLPWEHVGLAVAIVLIVLALSVAYALHRSHAASIVDSLRSDAI